MALGRSPWPLGKKEGPLEGPHQGLWFQKEAEAVSPHCYSETPGAADGLSDGLAVCFHVSLQDEKAVRPLAHLIQPSSWSQCIFITLALETGRVSRRFASDFSGSKYPAPWACHAI